MLGASDFVLLFMLNHWKTKAYDLHVDKMMIYHLGKTIGLWERKSALQMKWNARINEECSKNGSFDSSVGSVWASPFHFGGQVMEWWFLMHMLGSGLSRSLLLVLWFLVLQSLVEVLFRCDQPPSASQLVRLNHSYMAQTPGWDPVRLTWLRFEPRLVAACHSFLRQVLLGKNGQECLWTSRCWLVC